MSIQEDIKEMKQDIIYIKKMVEELTMTLSTKQNNSNEVVKNTLKNVHSMLANDPNVKKRPDITSTLNKLFEGFKV